MTFPQLITLAGIALLLAAPAALARARAWRAQARTLGYPPREYHPWMRCHRLGRLYEEAAIALAWAGFALSLLAALLGRVSP